VAAIHEGERLIGIWPLSLQRMLGSWIAKSLDEPLVNSPACCSKAAPTSLRESPQYLRR